MNEELEVTKEELTCGFCKKPCGKEWCVINKEEG